MGYGWVGFDSSVNANKFAYQYWFWMLWKGAVDLKIHSPLFASPPNSSPIQLVGFSWSWEIFEISENPWKWIFHSQVFSSSLEFKYATFNTVQAPGHRGYFVFAWTWKNSANSANATFYVTKSLSRFNTFLPFSPIILQDFPREYHS